MLGRSIKCFVKSAVRSCCSFDSGCGCGFGGNVVDEDDDFRE